MARANSSEIEISCAIEFVTDSAEDKYRVRILPENESERPVNTASFDNLGDALSWIGRQFPEFVARWKASNQFPPSDVEKETLRDVIYFVPDERFMADADRMNLKQMHRRVDEVYDLVRQLPRFDHLTPKDRMPANGIYVFFEQGETADWRGEHVPRIVRIGTHRKDDRFPGRIRQHYGRVNSLRGNKNGSVFRKHVGSALLRKADLQDPRLDSWLGQKGGSYLEVEEQVSRTLRNNFTFSCIRVDDATDRINIEKGLIALLARYSPLKPSKAWLGHHAASEKIQECGLWNVQRTTSSPISARDLVSLRTMIDITVSNRSD